MTRMSNQKCKAAHENSEQIATTKYSKNLCAGGEEGNENHFSKLYVALCKNNYKKLVTTTNETSYIS